MFLLITGILAFTILVICFCVFFDQAVFTRGGTVFCVPGKGSKRVALTFDDGPSPEWTPRILDELRRAGIKGTFFMIGHHVRKYPEIARRVAEEGHTIGNHGYAHSVMFYYTPAEIEEEIKYTEMVIREVTGQTTRYFRPPKAWLRPNIKDKIREMGYETVLWSLNSKDWVRFPAWSMAEYLGRRTRDGDIILLHDSGNVFRTEGGDRTQTVNVISLLAERLKARGFEFVALEGMLGYPSDGVESRV